MLVFVCVLTERSLKILLIQKYFISKQDIANLRRNAVINDFMKHYDDATSLEIMVNELQSEDYNPILVYKPQQKKIAIFSAIPDDKFIIAI